MRLPDFLGIGTQKGGTTYLHRLLQQHPQVFLAHPKELHYFSLHQDRGLDWYSNHFAEASAEKRCGEVTPYYLFHPLAAERIHAAIPNVKLIVLLRSYVGGGLLDMLKDVKSSTREIIDKEIAKQGDVAPPAPTRTIKCEVPAASDGGAVGGLPRAGKGQRLSACSHRFYHKPYRVVCRAAPCQVIASIG